MTNPCVLDTKIILPENYTYTSPEEDENFVVFRIKEVNDETSAKAWLEKLSSSTKVTWRVLRTFPTSGKVNIFKLCLRCQHSTDKRSRGERTSKNTNCPAELTIVVKRYVKKTRSKFKDSLVKEYPAIVTLKNDHNHELSTAAVLRYRELMPEVKEKFYQLFRNGHGPSSALQSHKIDLMLQCEDNYDEVAQDGHYVPTLSVVSKLFTKQLTNESGNVSGEDMFEGLQKLLDDFRENIGGKAEFKYSLDRKHYFVIICTPLMLRVHSTIIQSSELVMLDVSGGMDKQSHMIHFLVTPTAAGDLPLGVIVLDADKESIFSEALQCFKNLVGDSLFYSKCEPKVLIIDNDLKEINALEENFPSSKKLLCQCHMLKSLWSWLCKPKHNIELEHRQEAYFMFKNILYSSNEEAAEKHLEQLITFANEYEYIHFKFHILDLWEKKHMWVSYYRHNLPVLSNTRTNYVELVFRILKDCMLNKIRAFNLTQLVDFIITRYEMYMRQRLNDFSNARYSNCVLKAMLSHDCDLADFTITDHGDVYKVRESGCDEVTVDIGGSCSCATGTFGKPCKHFSAVILSLEGYIKISYNVVCEQTKSDIFYVAEGVKWFPRLIKTCPIEELEDNSVSTTEILQVEYSSSKNKSNIKHGMPSVHTEESKEEVSTSNIHAATSDHIEESEEKVSTFEKLQVEYNSSKNIYADVHTEESEEEVSTSEILQVKYSPSNNIHATTSDHIEESEEEVSTFEKLQVEYNSSKNLDADIHIEGSKEEALTANELTQLRRLFGRIEEGASSNPRVFVPAVRKMLQNEQQFASTESGLVSAIHTFGRYTGQRSSTKKLKKTQQRCHKFHTGVQLRRKPLLSGKRKFSTGRPSSQHSAVKEFRVHDYSTFGSLPPRKRRKASHNF